MQASPAETVRTLAHGHRPAQVHVAWSDTVWTAPSATDETGKPLLLTRDGGGLANAMLGLDATDIAVAISYADTPPVDGAPSRGRAWVCGWARPVPSDRRRDAAVTFSRANPLPDLLGIGEGFTLWEVSVDEVRWECDGRTVEIGPDEYHAAEPDPWYGVETDLLHHLHHHPEVIHALTEHIRRRVPEAVRVTPLRIDRHGTIVGVHCGSKMDERRFFVRHLPTADAAVPGSDCPNCPNRYCAAD